MKEEDIKKRVDALLVGGPSSQTNIAAGHELFHGALNIMTILYGPKSTQVENFIEEGQKMRDKYAPGTAANFVGELAEGALNNMKSELAAGVIGSLQRTITGEVLTDFLQAARAALDEKGDDAKNIAAVLAAALFEDTIRRLATADGIPHIEKLQDVITELKNKAVLQGPQVGIANSYLKFRNDSLHAQWENVGRESVVSVLGFVEQLLLKHFS